MLLLEDHIVVQVLDVAGWSFPPASLCRHRVRTISSSSLETGKRVGVWSLRILNTSAGFRKFIVSAISAISMRPDTVRCRRRSISLMISANFAKLSRFAVRNGFCSKNGTHQPCGSGEPFLLIIRTPCVVTATHRHTLRTECDHR